MIKSQCVTRLRFKWKKGLLAIACTCLVACSGTSDSGKDSGASSNTSAENSYLDTSAGSEEAQSVNVGSSATDAVDSSDSETNDAHAQTASSSADTPETSRPYINRLLPEAQRIQAEYDIPVDVTIAIAIHETGWGKHTIGQNNHFGLRCASDDCITLNNGNANVQYEACREESECFDMFAASIVELADGDPGNLRRIYRNGYATSPRWVRKVRRIRSRVRRILKEAGVDV